MPIITLLSLFLVNLQIAHPAKILGIFPDLSPSHTSQSRPLFRSLAARGHHVTILTGYPDPNPVPNYRDILIEGLPQFVKKRIHFDQLTTDGPFDTLMKKYTRGNPYEGLNELVLTANGTKTLLAMTETFDLVFVDLTYALFCLGFVHKFGTPPFIGIIPFGSTWIGDRLAGNPDNPAYVPNIMLPLTNDMSFFERFLNAIEYFMTRDYFFKSHLSIHDKLIKKHFGDGVPPVWETAMNMSVLMMNTDVAHDYPRPLAPMTVEIGGLHLEPAKKLPKDIKRFVDGALNGVIYFSLGSMLRSEKIGPAKLRAVLATFRALNQYRILWKWESDLPVANLPINVLARKWLPQNDVLGHDKVKLFITHGGISSLEEAIYHRVPMVVVPLLGDQFFQAAKMERHGIGVKVVYRSLSKETLLDAVSRVLNNASYKSNIARLNVLSQDKINSPLESAIFWTEYVLRHRGAQHLRSAGAFMSWEKFFLVDVITVLAAVSVGFVGLVSMLICVVMSKSHRRMRIKTWLHRLVPKATLESLACKIQMLMPMSKHK